MKPCYAATARNRDAILDVLRGYLVAPATVLEIGAGTGQHAVYFAAALPRLRWVVTDLPDALPGIAMWLREAGLANVEGPFELDVTSSAWPIAAADHAFSANTAHIMSWRQVEATFAGVARILPAGGRFFLYGPFNREGRFTSESNRQFDAALRARDTRMGVRDDAELAGLARRCGLELEADHAMPANNRTLVFRRS
jgi:cyclopropane fatty-acyl-phospholipid synthase-like methyltransferase